MCALSKFQIFAWETFQECLFTKLDRILSRALHKRFPGKNLNFDKAHHKQPLSLFRLDFSTFFETLGKMNVLLFYLLELSELTFEVAPSW